jgi:carbamoyl-phosphate synthase large subunit
MGAQGAGRRWTVEHLHELTNIDPWFLQQFHQIVEPGASRACSSSATCRSPRTLKRSGFGDRELAAIFDAGNERARAPDGGAPVAFTSVSTRARRSSSRSRRIGTYEHKCSQSESETESGDPGKRPEQNRAGPEFDYCCCQAFALQDAGFETVMINCNPETVSTDYDTTDRLYFEPLTFEDVMSVIEKEANGGGDVACLCSSGVRHR